MCFQRASSKLAKTQSLVTSFQASDTQKMNCCFDGLLMFPDFVFAWFSDSIQLWYLFWKATLNALLTAASKGWKSAVLPAGTNICVTFFSLTWSAADLTRCTGANRRWANSASIPVIFHFANRTCTVISLNRYTPTKTWRFLLNYRSFS